MEQAGNGAVISSASNGGGRPSSARRAYQYAGDDDLVAEVGTPSGLVSRCDAVPICVSCCLCLCVGVVCSKFWGVGAIVFGN